MTAPLRTAESTTATAVLMHDLGLRARQAARVLALAPAAQKNAALAAMALECRARRADILAANSRDLAEARASGAGAAFLDRLALDDKRIAGIAEALEVVRDLDDPVGVVMQSWTQIGRAHV